MERQTWFNLWYVIFAVLGVLWLRDIYVTATQEGPLDANGQPTILTAQTSFTDAANLKFSDGTGNVCGNGQN